MVRGLDAPRVAGAGGCHRPGRGGRDGPAAARVPREAGAAGEKDATLAQKLGQLPNSSLLWRYFHRNVWANLYLLGQPNTFLVAARRADAAADAAGGPARPAVLARQ
jgi:hypothetical protein